MCILGGYQLFKNYFLRYQHFYTHTWHSSAHVLQRHIQSSDQGLQLLYWNLETLAFFDTWKVPKWCEIQILVCFSSQEVIFNIIIIVEKFTFSVHLNKSWIFVKLYLVCTQQAQNGEYPKVENFAWTPGENIWRDDSWGICIGSYVSTRWIALKLTKLWQNKDFSFRDPPEKKCFKLKVLSFPSILVLFWSAKYVS